MRSRGREHQTSSDSSIGEVSEAVLHATCNLIIYSWQGSSAPVKLPRVYGLVVAPSVCRMVFEGIARDDAPIPDLLLVLSLRLLQNRLACW
jgi:hypothetical protein